MSFRVAARSQSALLAAVAAAYLALAIVATWPLAAKAADHVYGEGTPPLNIWALGFVLHQLPADPVALFDGNAFYPYRRTLALSEHLFVPALLAAPWALATGNLVLAHNAVALLSLTLAGLGMFLLARELLGDATASFVAGALYAFHTWNVNELVRLQILSNQWFPFLLWVLVRYFREPTRRRAAAVGLFYALQSLSCMYWALYAPLIVGVAAAFLQRRYQLDRRKLAPLGLGLALALVVSAPFALPYAQLAGELDLRRAEPEPVPLGRYFDVLPGNWLYRELLGTARPNQNAAHFLGFAAMALAALGLLRRDTQPDRLPRGLLATFVAAGLLLSLGSEIRIGERRLAPGPYAALFQWAPGFRNVRYPERFALVLVLGLAPLAAAGLARLRARSGRLGVAAVGAFAILEHLSAPLPLLPLAPGSRLPEVHHWLAKQPGVQVVAEVPASRYRMERHDALPMYHSTVHWKRTAQGFTGYFPPICNFVRWRLFHFPAPASVAFLARFGVDSVVVDPGAQGPGQWAVPSAAWDVSGPFRENHVVLRLRGVQGLRFGPPPGAEGLRELPRKGWTAQGSYPGAERALDGDRRSVWSTGEPQGRGDFLRVAFGRALDVARISIGAGDPYEFPMRFKLLGDSESEGWSELPFDEAAAFDGLFASLLHTPRDARIDIDLEPPRRLLGIRLRITESDPFWMPWSVPELKLYERQGSRESAR